MLKVDDPEVRVVIRRSMVARIAMGDQVLILFTLYPGTMASGWAQMIGPWQPGMLRPIPG
jgi:hypothetical protein